MKTNLNTTIQATASILSSWNYTFLLRDINRNSKADKSELIKKQNARNKLLARACETQPAGGELQRKGVGRVSRSKHAAQGKSKRGV